MALGLVYLAVAPSLESRLIDSRLNDLERIAPALAQQILATEFLRPGLLRPRGTTTNARVVLLRPLSRGSGNVRRSAFVRGLQLRRRSATIRSQSPTSRDLKPRSDRSPAAGSASPR